MIIPNWWIFHVFPISSISSVKILQSRLPLHSFGICCQFSPSVTHAVKSGAIWRIRLFHPTARLVGIVYLTLVVTLHETIIMLLSFWPLPSTVWYWCMVNRMIIALTDCHCHIMVHYHSLNLQRIKVSRLLYAIWLGLQRLLLYSSSWVWWLMLERDSHLGVTNLKEMARFLYSCMRLGYLYWHIWSM